MKIKLIALIACSLLSFALLAQQQEEYWFAFKINSIEKKGNNKFLISINQGTNVGITASQKGELWATVNTKREGESRHIANATVQTVTTDKSIFLVETSEIIFDTDIVFVPILVKKEKHTPYFFLIEYGIVLTDASEKPYYTLDELLQKDGQRLRTEKFISMQQAINQEGERLKQAGDTRKVIAGEAKGKLLHIVLSETDTLDVWSYLYHQIQDYTQTLGKTIPLLSDYTNYTLEGDLTTSAELKSLFAAADSVNWEKNFENYRRRINTDLVEAWYGEAKEFRQNEQYDKSENLLHTCIFLIDKLNEVYIKAKYEYEMALIFDSKQDYNKAIYWYNRADKSFEKSESLFGRGYALHFGAKAQANALRNEDALIHFKEAVRVRTELLKTEPENSDYKDQLFTSVEALASQYSTMQDHKNALSTYQTALDLAIQFKKVNSQADILWNTGFVYTDGLKDYESGNRYYENAFKLFDQLRDTSSMIELKRNLAINTNKIKNLSKAQNHIADAVALARSWNKPGKLAYVLDYQGTLAYDNKLYKQSVLSYGESEKIYGQLKDTVNWLKAKKNLRNSYKQDKQYSKAAAVDQERVTLTSKKDLANLADAYWDLAYLQDKSYLKNPRKAIELYGKVEKIYSDLKDTLSRVTVLNNLAFEYRDMGDSLNAYKSHDRALALTTKVHFKEKRADVYERYAYSYGHFRNKKKQMAMFNESMKLLTELNNLNKIGALNENIAEAYQGYYDYNQATMYFQKSIDAHHKEGSKSDEADSYWDLAYNSNQYLKKSDESISLYKKAYQLYMEAGDSVNASVILSNIGQNYWSKLNYEKAIESHKSSIELATKCKNYEQVSSSWSKLASLYSASNNMAASADALTRSVEAVHKVNDSTLLATAYHDLSDNYSKAKNYPQAFDYINKAIEIRMALRDTIKWAASLVQLGSVYHNQNDYKQAEKLYAKALVLQRKVNDKEGIVNSLSSLGILSQGADNNYKLAEAQFNEAIKLSTELKDESLLAFCYLRMKGLQRSQGKTAQAEAYVKKALDIYTKNKLWKDVASTWIDIGYDESYIYGNNTKALEWINKAEIIADTLNDIPTKAMILGGRGSIYREMGEFKKSMEFANESLKLYKDLQSEWGMAGAYIDLGNINKQLSEYDLALQNQMKADSLYRKINTEYNRLAPLANIGEIYVAQGDYKKGLEFYEKSLAIMQKANDLNENLSIIQACIGESYYYLNNYPESQKWLMESVKTANQVGAIRAKVDALGVLGRLKIEEKKYEEAFKYLSEGVTLAREKKMKIAMVNCLSLLGQLEVSRKNYTKAKPLLEESISTSRDMGKYSSLWEGLYWLGMMYKENKQLTESARYLKESIEVIEKIKNKVSGGEEARKLFSSDKNILKVYEALVSVLVDQGKMDEALAYLQKNNEDNLKDKFKGLEVKFENADKNKIIEQERDMKAKLDGIEQQIENEKSLPTEKRNTEKLKALEGIKTVAETDYLKFVNQQVNVRPELSKFFNNSVQPAQLKGKKKQIPKDMALLSYLPGENQLYIFIATSDTVLAKVVNVTRAQLTRNINAVLNVVRTSQGNFDMLNLKNEKTEREEIVQELKQQDATLKPFEELYQHLIAPVGAEISNKKRLCIIPNGSLSYVPFQILGKTLKNGKFSLLMNQYAIFYSNSTDMLLRVTEAEARSLNILAFGNPDKTLPSTEKEVGDIKGLYPTADVYLQDEATEDKAKFAGEEYNVIHFATHGNLDYEDFAKSYLTMAGNPAKDEDGMLTLEELWGMDVMSHLNIVVLSACQTAVSKGSDESSPVSPASGFLQNGVKSVVATLWKVDDEATSLLMKSFYTNIKTMDAVDALRQAQVTLSNNPKFSHPYYWAAAVLLGDWR